MEYVESEAHAEDAGEGEGEGGAQKKRQISICRCSVVSRINVIVDSIYHFNDFDWPPMPSHV